MPVKRPTKNAYKKILNKPIDKTITLANITNIKDIHTQNKQLLEPNKKIVNQIIQRMENFENIDFLEFRDNLYNIFIYHLDITECIFHILKHFIDKKKFVESNISDIFCEFYRFLKYYNNNYRPIYHLERFIFYLCKIIHGLE